MIYDTQPIVDCFRYIDEKTVAGAMDTKLFDESKLGVYVFYLEKI